MDNKVTIEVDQQYAPCGYLVVERGYTTRDDEHTILIQSDWDYPSLASNLGYVACECGATDGTIDCQHKTASEMIEDAIDFLDDNLGVEFDDPGYL